ncbi:MAG TPA: S-adenosylmethionine:tRNA ribosyltransferase-isomerase [Steroidobacter sp.]|uniref:S-adenosylmethionine:tRNA ribosyltransferase-isomerase n=1 Tax=Steroidobacter sp. TaxID=1978227 RepID=UPI002ED83F6B
MIPADRPVQRPPTARLLYIDERGAIRHAPRAQLTEFLRPGDLVIANDAATLPASLHGVHVRTGRSVEVRLAGKPSLAARDAQRFIAVVFGAGDYHTRTEDRPPPPAFQPNDELKLGSLTARIERVLDHPRLISLRFEGEADELWRGLATHGRPIQYAHLSEPLALWDVWTAIAGEPVAYEPPSAGFALDWQMLAAFEARDIEFATLTHAAGISSTGDEELDRMLPFDEPYRIPVATEEAIAAALCEDRRIIAIGTTVVRALEHSAATFGSVAAGESVANIRIGAQTQLRVVDVILSGTHEPGTSHYELLQAFTDKAVLGRADDALNSAGYRTHEFGDSVLIERDSRRYSRPAGRPPAARVFPEMQGLVGPAAPRILRGFPPASAHVVQESHCLSPARGLVCLRD